MAVPAKPTPKDLTVRRTAVVHPDAGTVDWQTVYTRELPRIYNYFRYRFGGTAVAEDLTSATFEKAWRSRERYRRELASFSTWLFTIARNLAADYVRTRTRDDARLSYDALPLESTTDHGTGETPDSIVARQIELAQLEKLLATLPDRDRELLACKYGAQLTNREIARLTGLSESNVGTLLHRIVTRLRQRWEE